MMGDKQSSRIGIMFDTRVSYFDTTGTVNPSINFIKRLYPDENMSNPDKNVRNLDVNYIRKC
jgi:hypothetical protein